MKKITLLFALLITSIGFSQDLLLGFESGESGGVSGSPFGDMPNPTLVAGTGSNTSQVLDFTVNPSGQPWQGINLNLSENVELTAATTKTMTIDVKSSTAITFLVKVNGGISGAPEAAAEVTHNGDGTWQTLSFTFDKALDGKAPTANGVYTSFVIHAFWTAGATNFNDNMRDSRTFQVDNIKGPKATTAAPTITPPSTAAPTPPARNAADVLSVYSDAYSNLSSNFDAGWCGAGAVETVQIAGNNTVSYKGNDCQGIILDNGVDASAFTKMHIDVYIAQEVDITGKVFNLKFVGTPTTQVAEYNFNGGSTPPLTVGSWISIDIDIDLSTIGDWKEFGITSNVKDSGLWYDNFYIYKDSGSGGGGGGDITVAAPNNPTFANASDYSSVYSGLGSATGIVPSAFAGASISEVTIGGNVSTKIEVPTGGGGGQFAFAPIDLVAGGFTHVYFNYYFDGTPEAGKVINYNIQGGGANIFGTIALPASKSANNQSWGTVNVALADLNNPGDPKNAISQVQFTMAGGSNPFGTVYLDNLIFFKAGTASVENNELLGFSMYPNPANNVLNISAKETIQKADIFNVLGKKVMSVNINKTKDAIDVSGLSSGIYLIKYNVNNTVGTAKFIKQ